MQVTGGRLIRGISIAALVLCTAFADALPAHADLYSALQAYKNGKYAHAFHEFRALARLGQPVAQLDLADMYYEGQGTERSDISAYAWAMLASQNGETKGTKLVKLLLPKLALAPGSTRVAGWLTAPYTHTALERTLLPRRDAAGTAHVRRHLCTPTYTYRPNFPSRELRKGQRQGLIMGFTVLPDGTTRLPRILFTLPTPRDRDFDRLTRESILRSKFVPRATGSGPIYCAVDYLFTIHNSTVDYSRLYNYVRRLKRGIKAGDPKAELYYGMLLMGGLPLIRPLSTPQRNSDQTRALRWLIKAAQAGIPLAQFEVGADMLLGWTVPPEVNRALRWLHLAAAQNEPHADAMLARRLLRGSPDLANAERAVHLLDQAAAKSNRIGELYLSAVLAASPETSIRNPAYALKLEKKVFAGGSNIDPTALEIRAAAHAAEGDFKRAVINERNAIGRARNLGWNLSALKTRLKRYQSGKPWFGNLLHYG